MIKLSEDLVPKRKIKTECSNHPKIPRDRRILMRKRRKLIKKLSKTFTEKRIQEIKGRLLIAIEISLQQSYKTDKQSNEAKALSAIKSNPKYFYSYAKKFSKTKSGIGPLLDHKRKVFIPRKFSFFYK